MPRPRLLPGQRRRAAEACSFCREAKKKCSGTAPCSHCLRRGIAAQCSISCRPRGLRHGGGLGSGSVRGPPAPARTPPPREEPPDEQSAVSPLTTRGRHRPAPGSDHGGDFCPPSPTLSRQSAAITAGAHRHSDASSMSAANPHARMLLNLRGERGKPAPEPGWRIPAAVLNGVCSWFTSTLSLILPRAFVTVALSLCSSNSAPVNVGHQSLLAARHPCLFCSWFAVLWPTSRPVAILTQCAE